MKLSARLEEDDPAVFDWWKQLKRQANQGEDKSIEGHDGRELHVADDSPGDNRAVLMKTADNQLSVTAIGAGDTPHLAIEFGAHLCYQSDLQDLIQWARDFAAHYGLDIRDTLVSRLDVRTDIDERFYRNDTEKLEGHAARRTEGTWADNGKLRTLYCARSNGICYRIYDKRHDVEDSNPSYWDQVWEAQGVTADEIWRVEFELHRDKLRRYGVETWDDLDREAVEQLWTYCTDWLRIDRQVWDRVQDASPAIGAVREEVEPRFDPSQLKAQVTGIIDRLEQEEVLDEDVARLLRRTIEAEEVDTDGALLHALKGLDKDTAARISNAYHASEADEQKRKSSSPRSAPSFSWEDDDSGGFVI